MYAFYIDICIYTLYTSGTRGDVNGHTQFKRIFARCARANIRVACANVGVPRRRRYIHGVCCCCCCCWLHGDGCRCGCAHSLSLFLSTTTIYIYRLCAPNVRTCGNKIARTLRSGRREMRNSTRTSQQHFRCVCVVCMVICVSP